MRTDARKIAIVATLDSKGPEARYLRDGLQDRGRKVCVIDVGTAGEPEFTGEISRDQIAAGVRNDALLQGPAKALSAVAESARGIVTELVSKGEISAIVGVAGGKGAAVFNQITRDLPFGFPKVLVTSGRPPLLAEIATTSDTILMPTLVDLFGLNQFTRAVLDNAISVTSGLSWAPVAEKDGPMVAITAFGVTTSAVQSVKTLLERAGITAIVFPANGAGGRTMESLIEKGSFDGVIDLTTTELVDHLLGGTSSAGEARLTAAGRLGIPQVIAPGATDMANFGAPETVPARFADRVTYRHTPMTTLVRTTPQDTAEIGRMTAARLNKASGPVAVFWPGQGVSDYDKPGNPFHDPVANIAWRDEMVAALHHDIPFIETNYHINDPAFAKLCADWMIKQIKVAT